jgi:cation/acetate symporter
MASTTMVQFLKGGMLLVFSTVLVIAVLVRGLSTTPDHGGSRAYHEFNDLRAEAAQDGSLLLSDPTYTAAFDWRTSALAEAGFVRLSRDGQDTIWRVQQDPQGGYLLEETLFTALLPNGTRLYNGAPAEDGKFFPVGHMKEIVIGDETVLQTGPMGPLSFLSTIQNSTMVLWGTQMVKEGDTLLTIYYQKPTPGSQVLRPGIRFKVENATASEKFNFISLMLALFCGTAALPHILIRYYTVPSQAAARKSTLVAIAAIGFFYILTLFMGLGAMTNGVVNIMDNNMSAPLLALSFGVVLFAIISSIAFATVLGTVSGLIVASSGAVAHDLMDNFFGMRMADKTKVLAGKLAAVGVGLVAIYLGIVFEGMNVSFLVGWAFAVAASANLPAILMLLFWKKTTAKGVAASIGVGLVSALGLILLSPDMYVRYGLLPSQAPISFNSPAAISIPLSFIALVVVSLLTKRVEVPEEEALEAAKA